MCGIAGVVSITPFASSLGIEQTLHRMARLIAHRGPDGSDIWHSDHVGLAHTRLAIIDLSEAGRQPMRDVSGYLTLTFNGEIYNYRELREELKAAGHHFRTETDSEVILNGYHEWGEAVVDRLRGMFAFALWDDREKRLFMARDRTGQKPLFFARHGDVFLFGSEIKSILTWPGFPRSANLAALHQYLTFQYVMPPHSAFEGIEELPPAHTLTVLSDGNFRTRRYWQLPVPGQKARSGTFNKADAQAQIEAELEEAVRLRMISDVPLGAFLSGGIDSSIIVALMAKHSTDPVKTFSIGFNHEEYDERQYARAVAERYGTEHHEFVVEPDAMAVLPSLVWQFGQPFGDSSALPAYYVSAMTKQHVTVALSGDGGDETFLGYQRYLATKIQGMYGKIPTPVRSLLAVLSGRGTSGPAALRHLRRLTRDGNAGPARQYQKWIGLFDDQQKSHLYGRGLSQYLADPAITILEGLFTADTDPASQAAWVDIHTNLPSDLLAKVDITSMAHGLEARSPFLDHKLMEHVAGVPGSQHLKGFNLKSLLKEIAGPLLPAELINRPKMGFGVPIKKWFRHELKDYLADHLLSQKARQRGLINPQALETMIADHVSGRADSHYQLWALLMMELWFDMWIDGADLPTRPATPQIV
jgi:asparagine synthase (glutamine-hydrolysing)